MKRKHEKKFYKNGEDLPEADAYQRHICSIEDAYVRLASKIVREQMKSYRRVLEKYDGSPEAMYQIKTLEREICTPYYAILTLNAIDLKQYCKDMRKKYDVPQI